jgi:hypothetical protein
MKVMTLQQGIEFCSATAEEMEMAFINFAPLCALTDTNLDFVRKEYNSKNVEAITLKQDGKSFAVVFVKIIFGKRLEAIGGVAIDKTKFHIQKILDGLTAIAKSKECVLISLSTRRKGLCEIFKTRGYEFAGVNFVFKV